MMAGRMSFGALVRREREAKEIGLREMAKKIGVSPTYLSKIERGDFDRRLKTRCERSPRSSVVIPTSCLPWRGVSRRT